MLRAVQGQEESSLVEENLIAGETLSNRGDRPHYLRAMIDGESVRLSGTQQSHALFGLSKADALVRLEPDSTVEVGESVKVIRL